MNGFLLLCLISAACAKKAVPAPESPHQALRDFTLNQSDLGTPIWHLEAARALLDQDKKTAALTSPHMKFFQNGRAASTLHSDTGLLHTDTQDLHLEGRVVAVSLTDKTVLKTSGLDYSSKDKKFITDREVVLTRPGGTVHGRGMEASPDLSVIKIFHQEAKIRKEGKEGTERKE